MPLPPSIKIITLIATTLATAACSTGRAAHPPAIGMPNPASTYCIKIGGKLDIVSHADGQYGICSLPRGEKIEEWTLFHRDHPDSAKP